MKRPRCPRGVAWATFINLYGHPTDICIEWPWSIGGDGYGQLVDCRGAATKAHIASCEMAHGPKPTPEHEAAHSCNNRACFNPRHLRWATRAENLADMIEHGTARRGEKSSFAVLTEQEVIEIRRRADAGARTSDLAQEFGVTPSAISNVRHRHSWAWLGGVS